MACAEWYVSFLLKLARAQDRFPWAAMPVFERVGFLKGKQNLFACLFAQIIMFHEDMHACYLRRIVCMHVCATVNTYAR